MSSRRDEDLSRDFKLLLGSENAHQRGTEFEKLLVRLFHRDGFSAKINAATARPRQTDIYTKRFNEEYIVEAKWHAKPIDISETDSLRSRLARIPPHFAGLLISMSGFTDEAIKDVEERRSQDMILFREDEVVRLFSGEYNLADLISKKRQHLRTQGKLLFSPQARATWPTETPVLPQTEELLDIKGKTSRSFVARHDFVEAVFTNLIPDSKSRDVYGPVFDLHLELPVQSSEDLRNCLGWFHQRFGLSGTGRYSIQQSSASWIGSGAADFIEELSRRDIRYQEVGLEYIHHTETLCYIDELQDGLLFIYGRNRWEGEDSLYMVEMTLRMPGVPVDARPFIELTEMTGQRNAYFVQSEEGEVYASRLDKPIQVKPLSRIISQKLGHEPLVSGLIIENPLRNKDAAIKRLIKGEIHGKGDNSPFQLLNESAVLMCNLMGWHDPDNTERTYFLRLIEASWGPGGSFVVAANCYWEEQGAPTKSMPNARSLIEVCEECKQSPEPNPAASTSRRKPKPS